MTKDYSHLSVPGGVCAPRPRLRKRSKKEIAVSALESARILTDRRAATAAVKKVLNGLDRNTFREVARHYGVQTVELGRVRNEHRKAVQTAVFNQPSPAPEEVPTTFKRVTHSGVTVMPRSHPADQDTRPSAEDDEDAGDDEPPKDKTPEDDREAKQQLEAVLSSMNLGEVSVHSDTKEATIHGKRKRGYELYYIPALKTGVLISNLGGKTFFIYDLEEDDIESAMEMRRERIMARKVDAKADDLIWNKDPDAWEKDLKEKLSSRPTILRSATTLDGKDALVAEKGDDELYHKTAAVLKHDVDIILAAFPGTHHEDVNIVDALRLKNILCADGKLRSGREVFSRAGCVIVDSIQKKNDVTEPGNLTKIWRALLKTAGYPVMDEEYFRNPANLRADLLALAEAQGHGDPERILARSDKKAVCSGRSFTARTYIHTAYVERNPGKRTRDADSHFRATRRQLLEEAGLHTKTEMDIWYMSEHLPHDMEACAGPDWRTAGLGTIRKNRSSGDCTPCHNGETIAAYSLLNRARLLGLVDGKKAADWRQLVEIAVWLEQVNPEIAERLEARADCTQSEIPLDPGPQVTTGWTGEAAIA